MVQTVRLKRASLEIKERQLVAKLCSENPSAEEVQWYEEQMRMFESENAEEAFRAMDNMLAGFGNQVTGKFLS